VALTATMYRIELDLSDIDRSVYRQESLRVAQHPSEELPRVIARVLGYALCWTENLQFARDLADSETPALTSYDDTGAITQWIEVGAPTAKRLHRASKQGAEVTVVTFRGPDDGLDALRRNLLRENVHRADEIVTIALAASGINAIADAMGRSSTWTVIRAGDSLQVLVDGETYEVELRLGTLDQLMA
jgi:uncharacterized protein YaeQ